MHSVCFSSQLLVSVLFIAVPNKTENFKIFLTLVCVFFLASMQSYSSMHRQDDSMAMKWWLGYIKCN